MAEWLKAAVLKRLFGHSRKPNKIHQILWPAKGLQPF
jgi:hypothetical protein